MQDLVAVIMAGGAGTRFWPVSTEHRPKQFLSLVGDRTLLQQSYDRLQGLTDRVLVLTAGHYLDLVQEQLPRAEAVGEPVRRDTAAAVALAALLCRKLYGDVTMLVLTADHVIAPVERFQACLVSAARSARESGRLYTFAIPPTRPETGYGYLELGAALEERPDGIRHHELASFREKPDRATAEGFLREGRFYWNSGMFCWTVSSILAEFEVNLPRHLQLLAPAVEAYGTPSFAAELERCFAQLEPISVDYAIMEKAQRRAAVVAEFDWSDVGGWLALEPFLHHREENSFRGRLACHQAGANIVFSEDEQELVSLVGVENLVVVRSGNRTLVAHRDRLEEVKKLVSGLQPEDR